MQQLSYFYLCATLPRCHLQSEKGEADHKEEEEEETTAGRLRENNTDDNEKQNGNEMCMGKIG